MIVITRILLFINWFMVSVRPSSYGSTWEVAKHERSARSDRQAPL